MVFADSDHALRCLERIGYYRLSAYWYPFRAFHSDPTCPDRRIRGDVFRTGTTFEDALRFYLFDKTLRLRLSDALERIEIAVRAVSVEVMGAIGPHAHRNPASYRKDFANRDDARENRLDPFLEGLDRSFARSKEEFAKHFRERYEDQHPPIWVAAGTWDWGNLSYTISFLSDRIKDDICRNIHPELRRTTLVSWMTSLNDVRNACAHHSRLWNRPLINSPSLKQRELPLFDDLCDPAERVSDARSKRLYGALAVIIFLLRRFYPRTTWNLRLATFVEEAGLAPEVSPRAAGFPDDWRMHGIWNADDARIDLPTSPQ